MVWACCVKKTLIGWRNVWDLVYSLSSRIFEFLRKLSRQFKLRRMSIFQEIQMAISRYCLMLQSHGWVHYVYCVRWYDLDLIQGQGHRAFELPTISEAVHAGGDDRSPLAGLSGLTSVLSPTFGVILLNSHQDLWHQTTRVSFCCSHTQSHNVSVVWLTYLIT